MDITNSRLLNQYLASEKLQTPQEVVEYFGAMQAQDFSGAKWSLGQRVEKVTDVEIEEAFNNGEILRTHVMRPTWHFVSPKNIRWLLKLTAPRVLAYNGYYYRKSGLTKDIFKKTNKIIERTLSGKKQLTRDELNDVLKKSKIPTDRLGLSYTIMQAELDGIICSGPRKGKQFTYVLLEERIPKTKEISKEESLARLTKLYFIAHGPATIQDAVWWSGLTAIDIKKGIDANGKEILSETIDGKKFWFGKNTKSSVGQDVLLLPTYDEYLIAYKDRSAAYEKNAIHEKAFQDGFWNTILVQGKIVGTWRRVMTKNTVHITPRFFRKLTKKETEDLQKAVTQYREFLQMKANISL